MASRPKFKTTKIQLYLYPKLFMPFELVITFNLSCKLIKYKWKKRLSYKNVFNRIEDVTKVS